jgi:phosphatidylinositol alpha-1,6-mannosyltransferase
MARLKRWAFRSSSRILAISHFAADTVKRLYDIDGDSIRLVAPAIEPDRFERKRGLPRWPERKIGPVLLTLGRLDPTQRYKGYDRVIRLCAALRDEYPFIRLIVGGSGPDREWLQELALGLGIADRVEFRGYVPDEQMPGLFAEADLFVLASGDAEPSSLRVEGFGIVLAEAAAAGLPSLAYAVGGVSDVVADGVSGLLTAPNEDALLKAARTLLGDHQRRHEMANAAVQHARSCLTWERSVAALHQTLQELAPDSPHLVSDDYRTSSRKNRSPAAR